MRPKHPVLTPSVPAPSATLPALGDTDCENAVIWVEKARHGNVNWSLHCTQAQLEYYRKKKRTRRYDRAAWCIFLLTQFFETPLWLRGQKTDPFLWGPCAFLPFWLTNLVCIIILSSFLYSKYLGYRSLGDAFRMEGCQAGYLLCTAGSMAELAFALATGIQPIGMYRLCRPFILIAHDSHVLQCFKRFLITVHKVTEVYRALWLVFVVFLWCAIVLFAFDHSPSSTKGFSTVWGAAASLWVLMSTQQNWPNVMMAQYEENRWACIFFFSFILVEFFLVQNMLLATIYGHYKRQWRGDVVKFRKNREAAINNAFHLLQRNNAIALKRWRSFIHHYCHPGYGGVSLSPYSNFFADRLFNHLDADGSGVIDRSEFLHIADLLSESKTMEDARFAAARNRKGKTALKTCAMVRQLLKRLPMKLDNIVDITLVFNALIALYSTYAFVVSNGQEFDLYGLSFARKAAVLSISLFSCVALLLSLIDELYPNNSAKNRLSLHRVFDIITAPLTLYLYALFCYNGAAPRANLVMRIIRSCRILWRVRFIREDLQLLSIILTRVFGPLATLLAVTFCFFATLGEESFGGIGMETDASYPYRAINFNDFFSSMVTLLVMFTFFNTAIISAVLRATHAPLVIAYFGSFFIVAYQLLFFVLVAVVLETYMILNSRFATQKTTMNEFGRIERRTTCLRSRSFQFTSTATMDQDKGDFARELTLATVLQQVFEQEWQEPEIPKLSAAHTVAGIYFPPVLPSVVSSEPLSPTGPTEQGSHRTTTRY
eukprot:GEMP01016911.1.p1 GENE.GEMP01016911.1~~GEMP01016911.1.p1  ORF type:complete len:771 (+),score=143.43 GEMP01016911.1:112-2424(+)